MHPVYILNLQEGWQNTWEGEIVRLRMDDLPVKGNLLGQIEEIQLGKDEGIGEQSAFIFHPMTNILALQSNRHGVSQGDFARYFETFIGQNLSITLAPVLQMSALQKLVRLKEVTNFEVKIASLTNTTIFGDDDSAVGDIIQLAEIFKAPSINIEFKTTLKKKQPSLLVDKVINTAQSIFRASQQKQNKITTLKVSGCDEENNATFIDLLKDRMKESIDVKNPSINRNIPYSIRQICLQEAWNKRINEILRMFNN